MSRDILLSRIDRDETQPRQHFDADALAELAQSIGASGLAVPILVRPCGERFVIVHGERRYRAVSQLGWETIPADVRDLSVEEAGWLTLIENIQRADLSPIEEARAYQARLSEGMTQEQLGRRIGKSQSHIATKLRFLKLPLEVQTALDQHQISEGHAKQLLRLDEHKGMLAMLDDILREHHSVHSVATVIDHHEKLLDALKSYLEGIVNIGENLRFLKAHIPPEMWASYLETQLRGKPTPTIADMLIALADNPPTRMDEVPDDVFDYFTKDLIAHAAEYVT